jgi:extracellular elastinolytic metalloproteinase
LSRSSSACDVFVDREVPRCIGSELATTFVGHLHPEARFRLVDGVVSKHTNVFHGHFVQLLDGVPIANSNLNVNVDLETGQIISYGDSTFAKSIKSRDVDDAKANTRKWASTGGGGGGAQIVLDNGPQHEDLLAEYSSPPFDSSSSSSIVRVSDPRHGLLTFLSMQSNNVELDRRLESSPRAQLVSQLSTTPVSGGSPHDVLISGSPDPTSSSEPTKASLVYVHDGESVKLAWKYEYKSDDNMYEAYLSADADVTPGQEQPLMVVDWVRDFRPTGGEIGIESLHELYVSSSSSNRIKNSKPLASSSSRRSKPSKKKSKNEKRSLYGGGSKTSASTSDPKEIAKLKQLSPEYKVFPWGV